MNKAILIADLGYGDAGKGSVVDYLTRQTGAHTIVRYNGGAQAAHNVITPDGLLHTFAQFGSGTFVPGVQTLLSRFMIVHPPAMLAEERHLRGLGVTDAFERMYVDREALIISPYQQAANRLKEIARGAGRHGSCGLGIGETMSDSLTNGADALTAGDLQDISLTRDKLERLRQLKLSQLNQLLPALEDEPAAKTELKVLRDADMSQTSAELFRYWASRIRLVDRDETARLLARPGEVIFEGAQGILLDEWWGFYPYNSWSTLTYRNADTILQEAGYSGQVTRLGLTRIYMTRHGAGPMVTEQEDWITRLPEAHNGLNDWQRNFRAGPLDLPALRYALQVTGAVDGLVVTHLDRLADLPEPVVCDRYAYQPRLADYISPDGRRIIPVADPTDLASQERLTRALQIARPEYAPLDTDPSQAVEQVCDALGVPTMLASFGPRAGDKYELEAVSIPISGNA